MRRTERRLGYAHVLTVLAAGLARAVLVPGRPARVDEMNERAMNINVVDRTSLTQGPPSPVATRAASSTPRLYGGGFADPYAAGHGEPLGIAGAAVYEALVALAAKEHGAALATRDALARGTYDVVGAEVIVVT